MLDKNKSADRLNTLDVLNEKIIFCEAIRERLISLTKLPGFSDIFSPKEIERISKKEKEIEDIINDLKKEACFEHDGIFSWEILSSPESLERVCHEMLGFVKVKWGKVLNAKTILAQLLSHPVDFCVAILKHIMIMQDFEEI